MKISLFLAPLLPRLGSQLLLGVYQGALQPVVILHYMGQPMDYGGLNGCTHLVDNGFHQANFTRMPACAPVVELVTAEARFDVLRADVRPQGPPVPLHSEESRDSQLGHRHLAQYGASQRREGAN